MPPSVSRGATRPQARCTIRPLAPANSGLGWLPAAMLLPKSTDQALARSVNQQVAVDPTAARRLERSTWSARRCGAQRPAAPSRISKRRIRPCGSANSHPPHQQYDVIAYFTGTANSRNCPQLGFSPQSSGRRPSNLIRHQTRGSLPLSSGCAGATTTYGSVSEPAIVYEISEVFLQLRGDTPWRLTGRACDPRPGLFLGEPLRHRIAKLLMSN